MLPTVRTISSSSHRSIIKLIKFSKRECLGQTRVLHTANCLQRKAYTADDQKKSVAIFDIAQAEKKQKNTFLDILHTYMKDQERKIGHVQFIYAALRYMKDFGVDEDIEAYKSILDTLPKGRYVATNLYLAETWYYPREQQCIIDLLQQMEDNGVIPDPELETMVINIVGEHAFPLRKLRRMAYWQGKFKNLNPWPWPRPLPNDALELAKEAIKKVISVDVQSKLTVFDTEIVAASIDKTWIVSGSSPDQERLIAAHPEKIPAYVEGPFRIWVSKVSVDYFLLWADPINRPIPDRIDLDDVSNLDVNLWKRSKKALTHARCIHEQDNMTIFGICATGTSTKDSLLSWIRCLQFRNPTLEKIPILFKFISREQPEQIPAGTQEEQKKITDKGPDQIKD